MRLKSLTLRDFKGFTEATLDLDRPLTVLVGANGTGKTSVLEAITLVVGESVRDSSPHSNRLHLSAIDGLIVRTGAAYASIGFAFVNGEQYRRGMLAFARSDPDRAVWDEAFPEVRKITELPLVFVLYPADRQVTAGQHAFSARPANLPAPLRAVEDAFPAQTGFRPLFTWFKDREDVENEQKVARADLTLEDPLLGAVRRAVVAMLPGYSTLRVQRDPLQFTVRKDRGEALNLDQLSAGERSLLALAADIARRLAIAYPDSADPLAEEGVILIDEIELHLHPRWQRSVIGSLRRTFPNCQFIVTTHSPQVLSEVPTEAVVVIDHFTFLHPAAPTSGRDTNAILEEVMDTGARPAETQQALDAVSTAIDHEDYASARASLDRLTTKLTEDDAEIVRLRGLLEFLTTEVVGGSA